MEYRALSSVAEIKTGNTPSKGVPEFFSGDIPFITPTELNDSYKLSVPQVTLSQTGALKSKVLPPNSVLVCCIGSLGKTGFADVELCTNQQINSLIFDELKVEPRFGFHFVRTLGPHLRKIAPQTTIPIVNKSRFSEILIPLPAGPNSLAEQKRIAAILDKADGIRRKRQQALQLTDDFLRSTFLKLFGDPVSNPMGWGEKKFGTIVDDSFRNGLSPSNRGQVDGSVLTLSAVTSGKFDSNFTNKVKFDRAPSENQLVDSSVFLICRGNGNLKRVGVGVFAPIDQGQVAFPDTVIGCNPNNTEVTKEYLRFAWSNTAVRRQIERAARTTNGTYKVNQEILSQVVLLTPPLKKQQLFSSIVRQVTNQQKRWENESNSPDELFKSLQQRAFSGQL